MPIHRKLNTGPAALVIWRITESEEQLKAYIGGDSFPGLMQFSDINRRLEWLATRCSLKQLGITEPIIYAKTRRPYLANGKQHISITHSFPYVTVAASSRFFVGIDIESLNRPYNRIADKFLTLGEKEWIDIHNTRLMALVWSAKEALYKIPGMEGLNSFVDMSAMPISRLDEKGIFSMRVRMGPLVQTFSIVYAFMGDYVITGLACHPRLLSNRPAAAI